MLNQNEKHIILKQLTKYQDKNLLTKICQLLREKEEERKRGRRQSTTFGSEPSQQLSSRINIDTFKRIPTYLEENKKLLKCIFFQLK